LRDAVIRSRTGERGPQQSSSQLKLQASTVRPSNQPELLYESGNSLQNAGMQLASTGKPTVQKETNKLTVAQEPVANLFDEKTIHDNSLFELKEGYLLLRKEFINK